LSVIIPAYNEEKRLQETLKKLRDYFKNQKYTYEVYVVNDGSRDGTAEVVGELMVDLNKARRDIPERSGGVPNAVRDRAGVGHRKRAGCPEGFNSPGNFRLIDNKENRGKGAVVKQGMLEAKGDWRLFMDADNSTDIEEIEKLWDYAKNGLGASFASSHPNQPTQPLPNQLAPGSLKSERGLDRHFAQDAPSAPEKYDVIIGSRYLKADSIKIKQPLIRRMVSRFGNWLSGVLLGLDIVDTQCGFKLFSAKAAEDIFPKQTIMRWGFDMEILAIAKHRGYQIKEVAVDWYDSTGSTVRKSAALKTLKELIIIKWNLMRGKYR
jgi:glycosyltransferase involved in cell wall biosynthesis